MISDQSVIFGGALNRLNGDKPQFQCEIFEWNIITKVGYIEIAAKWIFQLLFKIKIKTSTTARTKQIAHVSLFHIYFGKKVKSKKNSHNLILWSQIIRSRKSHIMNWKMCFGENSQGCYCCRRSSHNENTKYISSDNEIIIIGKNLSQSERKKTNTLQSHYYRSIDFVRCIEAYQPM